MQPCYNILLKPMSTSAKKDTYDIDKLIVITFYKRVKCFFVNMRLVAKTRCHTLLIKFKIAYVPTLLLPEKKMLGGTAAYTFCILPYCVLSSRLRHSVHRFSDEQLEQISKPQVRQ